ncbi:hypothetical protein [Mycobacterium phage CELFI]|uniref:Uncharacterized protein n=1 Tax=Mycobacterium phage CELFI TaxID=2769359 RepID=A0A7G9V423_9CAUD|nr:hypothetical protein J4T95_gp001 [Mycobacterium phage CELFI]QNO01029.1 hypothetical protein [Mycobacterium phage CELFI]
MGGRGAPHARNYGGRDRSSRKASRDAYQAKPRNAMEYAQQLGAKEGWEYSEKLMTSSPSGATRHMYGTFTKGDVSIGVQYTDRPRTKGRISDAAVRKNGKHTSDYFGTASKDKRKAMKELFKKYG